jgi:hypothetical protein
LVHLVAVILALTALIPRAQTARADAPTICTLTATGPTCPTYPPPDLLNLSQGGLYAATPDQTASLQNLEDQAVSDIITGHDLADGDADAVKSWARADAEADLYARLLLAVNTGATSRTTDQQNAVDWITAVAQRQAVQAAEDAALEYVTWAGLDRSQYQSLLNDNASESDLQSFLSGTPQNYNLVDNRGVALAPSQYAQSAGGWCVYRSPAPYDTEYTGINDSSCAGPCLFCVLGPTPPTYDQFTKWGEADAEYSLLNSGDFGSAAKTIAEGMGIGVPLAALVAGAPAGSRLAAIIARDAALAEKTGEAAKSFFTIASEVLDVFDVVGAVGLVITVIADLVTAIIEAVNLANAAKLPGQLATLITNTETTPPDPATLESSSSGTTSLFSLFVGATLPTPINQTCDNSPVGISNTGPITGTVTIPCLNPTAIPPASPTDPQFVVQAQGATTQTTSRTITWKDAASGTTTTARLSETWFIENESVQTLRIKYTDWDGKEQNAWLLGDPTDGYAFLNFSDPADSSTTLDSSTCVANGLCSYGTSIDYVGGDGQDYSASVQAYTPTTGTPTVSTAVEGSPVTFDANGYAPVSATAPITYTWQFQKAGCGIPCITFDITTLSRLPNYTDPVSGGTASYTWQTSGNYLVSLTATDANGAQANDTFTVSVGDVPPRLTLYPPCPSSPYVLQLLCNPTTGDVGTSMPLAGSISYTGALDNENVTVSWGDGSKDTGYIGPNNSCSGQCLTLTPLGDKGYILSDTHTYAKPGIYTGTVWVYDWGGGADSKTFKETIQGTQSISFPAIPTHTYGDAHFAISATGGASGRPVTFVSTDTTVCTIDESTRGVDGSGNGTGSANVRVLKAGTCAITASQGGNAIYHPAPDVTQSFTVQPAPLTVTASSASSTYGGTAPAITPSYSGFVNGDTSSILTTQATCAVAPNSAAAGTYATTCAGASDPNYSVSYVPGTLTIKQAPLTVTANNKSMTYGAGVPAFDAGYSGLLNGDTGSVVSGLTCGAVDGSTTPVSGSTPAGTYPITCSGGTAANYAISYQPGTLTITRANTSLTLAAAPTSSVFGQPVTITAGVAVTSPGSGHPGGTVEFKDGGADIGGCAAQPVSTTSETATCTTSALSVATHSLTASYSGDSNVNGSSTAAALSQPVNKAASNVTLAPTTPSTQGQPATFTAVVAATLPGAGTPSGTVTFKEGSTTLGTGQLSVVGGKDQAAFSTSSLAVGPHTITASYGGDGNFTASSSAASTQYVNTNLSGYPKLPSGAYNLSNANLAGAYFVGVSLAGTSLTGSNLTGATFTGANLSGANLSNSNLKGANFSGVNLSGANLSSANLMGATGLRTATLTGVIWSKTACPDGTLSNSDGGTCVGHL